MLLPPVEEVVPPELEPPALVVLPPVVAPPVADLSPVAEPPSTPDPPDELFPPQATKRNTIVRQRDDVVRLRIVVPLSQYTLNSATAGTAFADSMTSATAWTFAELSCQSWRWPITVPRILVPDESIGAVFQLPFCLIST